MTLTIPGKYYALYDQYRPLFDNASRAVNGVVPPELLAAVAYTESRFNKDAVSPAGARGMMQFMPGTAAHYKVNVSDPYSSILGAAKYLADLNRRYKGNWENAIMAYNWGEGNVDAYLKTGFGKKGQVRPKESLGYTTQIAKLTGMNFNSPTQAPVASPNTEQPLSSASFNYFYHPDSQIPAQNVAASYPSWNLSNVPLQMAFQTVKPFLPANIANLLGFTLNGNRYFSG